MQAAVLYGPQHVTLEDLPLPSIGESEVLSASPQPLPAVPISKSFARRACPYDYSASGIWT